MLVKVVRIVLSVQNLLREFLPYKKIVTMIIIVMKCRFGAQYLRF